jgi:hypothetical protein
MVTELYKEILERLAELEHDRWSRWERYRETAAGKRHSCGELNDDRWRRQRETPYSELTETEKNSDRQEAERTLAIVREHVEVWRGVVSGNGD